jgi:hypothetical protein
MKSKAAIRTVLVRVVNYLKKHQEDKAADALMNYIIEYFPIFG